MSRLRTLLSQPSTWVRVHGCAAVVWALLMIPSVLWWKDSLVWVIIMSCYANFAGSVASWQSAKADRNSVDATDFERVESKIDAVRKALHKKK